jgi:hypothetical protein
VKQSDELPAVALNPAELVDALYEPALLIDSDHVVCAVNAAMRAILGDVRSKNVTEIDWPVAWAETPAFLQDGRTANPAPCKMATIGRQRLLLFAPDEIIRPQLLQNLDDAHKFKLISRLAAGAAHEINNPLGGIVQSVQLIKRALDLDNPRTRDILAESGLQQADLDVIARFSENRRLEKFAGIIQEASGRVTELIGSVLGFTRFSLPERQLYNVNELLDKALFLASVENDMRKEYAFRDIAVERPDAAMRVEVQVDMQSFVRVLIESLKVAVGSCLQARQMAGDDYVPSIAIDYETDTDGPALVIRSNGAPLERDTSSIDATGNGWHDLPPQALSLALCRKAMVSLNQGDFSAQSEETGIRITISFGKA